MISSSEDSQSDDSNHAIIDIVISSETGQFKITTRKHEKFVSVASCVCELTGWKLIMTRFILNGERLQNDLTFEENEVQNHSVIDVMFEMAGGKGPTDLEIQKMLEEASSGDDESDEMECPPQSREANSDSSHTNLSYKLYEELKLELKEGTLVLDRSNCQDQKLLLLLETEDLEPYEILRLRNVYSCWEQHKLWKEDSKEEIEIEKSKMTKVKRKVKASANLNRENRPKRTTLKRTNDSTISSEDITPTKRRTLLDSFGLNTPSPLVKNSHVTEIEMKRISVSVHLWAERKMGGLKFLHNNRLENHHFEDILRFTGSESKWKLMKNRTVPQLRSLWRNSFGGKQYYRGHIETGYESEFHQHEQSVQFCPFKHCESGFISPMDLDLIVLTPTKVGLRASEEKRPLSSRKLFNEKKEEVSYDDTAIRDGENNEMPTEQQQSDDSLGSKDTLSHTIVDESEYVTEENDPNFVCKVENCGKTFQTFFGLQRHKAVRHSDMELEKEESQCPICYKTVFYLDKHMRTKHSDIKKQMECEVCLTEISSNMQKHRKSCNQCRYCDYTNSKKARLLNHIKKCPKKDQISSLHSQDQEPLDLRSPFKVYANKTVEQDTMISVNSVSEGPKKVTDDEDFTDNDSTEEKHVKDDTKLHSNSTKETLEKGRVKYPFDEPVKDEDYYSEIDIDDDEMFTIRRRKHKDDLELQLRVIDDLQNPEIEGDNLIVEKFIEFMRNKRNKDVNVEGYSKQTEPTTIQMYAGVVRNDILRAFHKLVEPFDARWLTDCRTPKECKFEGEERLHVMPQEPIYMTSRVLQEALQRHEASGNSGNEKKKVIAAFNQMMEFIELHFTLKLNAYGVDVLSRVQTYHRGVKSFIKGTSQWKKNNDEERDGYEKNKIIDDYKCPNKDVDILEKYKEYVKSEERISKISKLLSFAYPDAKSPPPSFMTEFGITVMEEIVACTGCRPKVVRHLKMGALVDAKPGFNPYKIGKDEKTLEEDLDGDTIYRRVNPNLPPAEKACIHQLRDKTAICQENCDDQCIPEGYNIWVSWDKTQSTKGPYFLHIPTPIKDLMDRYDIIRTNFFKEKRPKFSADEFWLENADTPFFLNSQCGIFPSLNLRKLSNVLGIDITAYAFRKIVSTWALSHKSEEIRAAEEEALQHSLHVAKERYLQCKQIQPQNLIQTYSQEENLFPENFRNELKKDKTEIEKTIAKKKDDRTKMRYANLSKERILSKKIKFENRPLGPRTAVLESDRQEFTEICESLTGSKMKALLSDLKPIHFRDFVVRLVCSSTGERGGRLRELWLSMYRGDLLHGIRDLRRKAKEQNWPLRKQNPGRKDRNSWISHNLRKSCQAAKKFEET
jgi:hypothetical protein